ncbi:MAG: basic rane protein [Frankiales bacterium]|nr:basic rane protein [Frankiales bacterium]
MRTHRAVRLAAVGLVSAMSVAACGSSSSSTPGAASQTTGSASAAATSGTATSAPAPAATSGSASAAPASSGAGSATASSAPVKSNAKVGLVFDLAGKGDKSFNDAADAGLMKAVKDMGITEKELTPNAGGTDREQLLKLLASQNYNPVIAVGFAFDAAVKKIAKAYPKTNFAIVDDVVDLPNVASLTFSSNESSYLVGAVAALKSKTGSVGFIGGVDVPLLQSFQAGFDAGAKHAKPAIKIQDAYLTEPPDFGGFNAPDKATVSAKGMYDKGADVIYAAAGGSGAGVFLAAKAAGKFAIGVDSDQVLTADASVKNVILTSALKRVDTAVYLFLKDYAAGKKDKGTQVFDLKNDGVGYSTTGGQVDDIKAQLEAIKADIISGKITVPSKP